MVVCGGVGKLTGRWDSEEATKQVQAAASKIQAVFLGNRFFRKYTQLRKMVNSIHVMFEEFEDVAPAKAAYDGFFEMLSGSSIIATCNVSGMMKVARRQKQVGLCSEFEVKLLNTCCYIPECIPQLKLYRTNNSTKVT